MEKLTEQTLKKKIRNNITLMSVTKDEIRQEYNEIFDKLKEYENSNEWISVEDRLPDEDGEYLTYNGLIYYLLEFNTSVQLWNVSTTDISTAIRGVTHWMPLPQPPKMKGAE